ncbi:hypothetical protein Prum_047570 [Phytohabitans rumicis]|uniref:DivIVA domain-containing protein n=1 Tax=Phytohabitans rumicis TaxID=1076125 RepID=A0A6V8LEM5_9ACTN|nr:hypothetical protein Prum_047570 [Phytohabitans rumicis]
MVVALTVAAVVFGVTVLVTGGDPGLGTAEPDGRAVPLPGTRPLMEADVSAVRFDTTVRGYRMAQVDQALRRAAYDIGYKDELIGVLEAEVTALREGRSNDADVLRRAREAALAPTGAAVGGAGLGPAVPPAGLVDLGDVSGPPINSDNSDKTPVVVISADEADEADEASDAEPDGIDDEVDTDTEPEADDDAVEDGEDGEDGEPEDDVDTDVRAKLPDRDERA